MVAPRHTLQPDRGTSGTYVSSRVPQLAGLYGPATVLTHSYGGLPATEAGAADHVSRMGREPNPAHPSHRGAP